MISSTASMWSSCESKAATTLKRGSTSVVLVKRSRPARDPAPRQSHPWLPGAPTPRSMFTLQVERRLCAGLAKAFCYKDRRSLSVGENFWADDEDTKTTSSEVWRQDRDHCSRKQYPARVARTGHRRTAQDGLSVHLSARNSRTRSLFCRLCSTSSPGTARVAGTR